MEKSENIVVRRNEMIEQLFHRSAKSKRKVIGWGTGTTYTVYNQHYPVQLDYLVDNDINKNGKKVNDLLIYPPERLRLEDPDNTTVIIYSCGHSSIEDIKRSLCSMGIFSYIAVNSLIFMAHRDEVAACFWDMKKAYRGVDRNHWGSSPILGRLVSKRLTGESEKDWLKYIIEKYLEEPQEINVLVLGCGTGSLERQLSQQVKCNIIDAIDISEESLAEAKRMAAAEGCKGINYIAANLNEVQLDKHKYNLIFAQECIHHLYNLEHIYQEIDRALAPGGLFIQAEYVGPNHFQLTKEQVDHINGLLNELEPKYKRYQHYERIPLECMMKNDPSEAIRAEEILPLTDEYFEIIEQMNVGGNIVSWIFYCINTEHFYEDITPYCSRLLTTWMEFEESNYLSKGKTDAAIVISTKKVLGKDVALQESPRTVS